MRIKTGKPIARLLLFSIFLVLTSSFSYTNFQLTDSNQGANSHYVFSFVPDIPYDFAEMVITFPIEYSVSSFAGALECYFSGTGMTDQYSANDCWV